MSRAGASWPDRSSSLAAKRRPRDQERRSATTLHEGETTTALYIIFGIIVYVIPAVCILGDDAMWDRKK